MLRGLTVLILMLYASVGFAAQRMCVPQAQSVCYRPTPEQKTAADLCRIEMKNSQCDVFFKDHPEVVREGKSRNCEMLSSCTVSNKISDYGKACLENWAGAWGDTIKGIAMLLSGQVQGSVDLKEREAFFAQCTSAECKREMLGPYADLFTKEEIEGSPNDKNLNPADPVNQNYLQGYSAKVLYKKLLQRISKKLEDGTLDEPVIEPWSGKPAKALRTADQMIDDTLVKMGFEKTACFDPVVLAEKRCYALFTVLDPLILVSAGKLVSLAGKGVAKVGLQYSTEKGASDLVAQLTPLKPSDGKNLLMREVSEQGYKEGKQFRTLYIGKDEAAKMRKIAEDPNISDVELPSALFDVYKEARFKDLTPAQRAKVEAALRNTTVTERNGRYLGVYNPKKNSIEIATGDKSVETFVFYDKYIHEIEHSIQRAQDTTTKKVLRDLAAKTFSNQTESRFHHLKELGAIKSQYDFLRGMPAEAVERMSKEMVHRGFGRDAVKLKDSWSRANRSFEEYRANTVYSDMAAIKASYPDQITNFDRVRNVMTLTLVGGDLGSGGSLSKPTRDWVRKVLNYACVNDAKLSKEQCDSFSLTRSGSK